MSNHMTLDDALNAARKQLQDTAVPEQDLAVARAHMLAAHARMLASQQATPRLAPAPMPHALAGSLVGAGNAGSNASNMGFLAARIKWIVSLLILILAGIWLQMPVFNRANEGDIAIVSADISRDFMPLVDSSTWAKTQHAVVMPAQLAVTELAALGLPFDASRAADTVHAELLMNDTGDLIGVRLLTQHEAPYQAPAAPDQELG